MLDQQHEQQARWQLKPAYSNLKIFDELLKNEYIDLEQRQLNLDRRTAGLVSYCAKSVPFYQELFKQQKINHRNIGNLEEFAQIPVLERGSVQKHYDALVSQNLPAPQQIAGVIKTSGTTGQPVSVLHTAASSNNFTLLKQREYRSWGFDPGLKFASIRPASDLVKPQGKKIAAKSTFTLPHWEYVGEFFETGEMPMLPDTSGEQFILDWLDEVRPDYVLALSAVMEQIALGFSGSHVRGCLAISQQMTTGMRKLIEANLSPNLEQNYGLNEIGLVAMRCHQSGYYHVHNEHCLIEIVNDDGVPCKPGTAGKLLVTALQNLAMPLLRYDTDDYAELVDDECPCGRTLQSFKNLRGRYRRTAHLPDGTWAYWDALLGVFGQASATEMQAIQQYQLHQKSAQEYLLRLKVSEGVHPDVIDRLKHEWGKVFPDLETPKLEVLQLEHIVCNGKKFQNFISDLVPDD